MQLWVKSSLSVILNGWFWFYRVCFWDAHTPDVLYNKDHINILGLHLFGFCFPFPHMSTRCSLFHSISTGSSRGLSVCLKDWPNMLPFPMVHSQSLGTWHDQSGGAQEGEVGQQRGRGKSRSDSSLFSYSPSSQPLHQPLQKGLVTF